MFLWRTNFRPEKVIQYHLHVKNSLLIYDKFTSLFWKGTVEFHIFICKIATVSIFNCGTSELTFMTENRQAMCPRSCNHWTLIFCIFKARSQKYTKQNGILVSPRKEKFISKFENIMIHGHVQKSNLRIFHSRSLNSANSWPWWKNLWLPAPSYKKMTVTKNG